ncbi:MAG: tetratricopeptide repeat protein [Puniceicoccaceae bacterium]
MSESTLTIQLSREIIEAHEKSLKLARGEGCEKDLAAAIEPMRKAAEGGHPHAQCNLGFLYAMGEGIDRDIQQAMRWLSASAEKGNVQAMFNLTQIMESGRVSPIIAGRHSRL